MILNITITIIIVYKYISSLACLVSLNSKNEMLKNVKASQTASICCMYMQMEMGHHTLMLLLLMDMYLVGIGLCRTNIINHTPIISNQDSSLRALFPHCKCFIFTPLVFKWPISPQSEDKHCSYKVCVVPLRLQ